MLLAVAKTLVPRFLRWRTTSRPRPRLPLITKHDPGRGEISSVEEEAIVLYVETRKDTQTAARVGKVENKNRSAG